MLRGAIPSAICLLFLISTLTFAQDDDDVVKIDSSVVVLNATISDADGNHVSGLRQSQFTVLENGVQQDINFFAAEETPFAAVILLDTSGSMEQRVSLARS